MTTPAPESSNAPIVPVEVISNAPASSGFLIAKPDFSTAINFRERARLAASQATVYMVLCGAELVRLKKELGETRGGDQKSADRIKSRNVATFEDLAKEAGFSSDTARRYIQLYEAGRKRVTDEIRPLLELPLTALDEAQKELVTNAVSKITDGKTQLELFQDWGIAKKSGPKGKGGARTPGDGEHLSEEARRELAMQSAREHFMAANESLGAVQTDFTLLPDDELQAQLHKLNTQVRALQTWLNTPKSKRGPETLATIQALLIGAGASSEPLMDEGEVIDARA